MVEALALLDCWDDANIWMHNVFSVKGLDTAICITEGCQWIDFGNDSCGIYNLTESISRK